MRTVAHGQPEASERKIASGGGVLADEALEARRKHEALSIRISVGREHLSHDVKGMSDFCQILRSRPVRRTSRARGRLSLKLEVLRT